MSSGFPTKLDNQSPQLERPARKMEFACRKLRHDIFFKKRITKALISLRGCTCCSVSLLFANDEDMFSRIETQYNI